MNLTDQQTKRFLELATPLIHWLRDNCHPHVAVIVDNESVQLMEGITARAIPWPLPIECGDKCYTQEELLENGWKLPTQPPAEGHEIQLAWEDGSFGASSKGGYYPHGLNPGYHCHHPAGRFVPISNIMAWRYYPKS